MTESETENSVSSLRFPAIDRTPVTLADISRHEQSGRRPITRSITAAAIATPDTAPGTSTGRQRNEETSNERKDKRLRKNPKKTKLFGSPVSSLLKKKSKR